MVIADKEPWVIDAPGIYPRFEASANDIRHFLVQSGTGISKSEQSVLTQVTVGPLVQDACSQHDQRASWDLLFTADWDCDTGVGRNSECRVNIVYFSAIAVRWKGCEVGIEIEAQSHQGNSYEREPELPIHRLPVNIIDQVRSSLRFHP